MQLTSSTLTADGPIPSECAFGIPDTENHMRLGDNRNPQLSWSDIPSDARSLVLICVDPDVPATPDGINEEGQIIPVDRPRTDFYHWVMVDLPPKPGSVELGEYADGVVPGGKQKTAGPDGSRQGINDYTSFLAGNPEMGGQYFGYDGPCPPWNDERIHHYNFVIYATTLDNCPVAGAFTGSDVMAAIQGHVIAEARLVGTYTLNPEAG